MLVGVGSFLKDIDVRVIPSVLTFFSLREIVCGSGAYS